ncbi:MAG: thioredoxin domain-containing protein [Candidatus Micrarchaeota archaeon]
MIDPRDDRLKKMYLFFIFAIVFIGMLSFDGCITDITEPKKNTAIINVSFKIEYGTNPALGEKNASITVIEFTDYQCPYCKRYATTTFPQLKNNYIQTGRIKYYLRDFPLGMHVNAENAALSARCAGEQNKYWEMHTVLFTRQNEWEYLSKTELASKFKEYAFDLKINEQAFFSCYHDHKFKQQISSDIEAGNAYGITGVPYIMVLFPKEYNETKLVELLTLYPEYTERGFLSASRDLEGNHAFIIKGALPYAIFEQLLD